MATLTELGLPVCVLWTPSMWEPWVTILAYEVNWSPEGLEGLAELTGLPRLAEFRVQFVLSWVPFRWLGTLFGRPLGVLRHHFSEPGLPRDAQGDTWGSNHGF